MSPAEAWDYEEAKGNNLIKLPAWCICQILGMEMARPIKVASAYIRMRNKDIRDEELIYEARVVTPDGARRELAPGKYQGYVNPYDANQLFVCGQDGRIIALQPSCGGSARPTRTPWSRPWARRPDAGSSSWSMPAL